MTENFLLKTMQDRRHFVLVTFLKYWKENMSTLKSLPTKNTFQKQKWNKNFFQIHQSWKTLFLSDLNYKKY